MAQAPGPRTPSETPPSTPPAVRRSGGAHAQAMRGRMQTTHVSVPPGFERYFASPESSVSASASEVLPHWKRKVAVVSVGELTESLEQRVSKASDFKVFHKYELVDVEKVIKDAESLDPNKKRALLTINEAIDKRYLNPESVIVPGEWEWEEPLETNVVKPMFEAAQIITGDRNVVDVEIEKLMEIRKALHATESGAWKQVFAKIWFYKASLFFKALLAYGGKGYCQDSAKSQLMMMMMYGCHNELYCLLPARLIEEIKNNMGVEKFEEQDLSKRTVIIDKLKEYLEKREILERYVSEEQGVGSGQYKASAEIEQIKQEWGYESTKQKVIEILAGSATDDSIDISSLPPLEMFLDREGNLFPHTTCVLQYTLLIAQKLDDHKYMMQALRSVKRMFFKLKVEDKEIAQSFWYFRVFQYLEYLQTLALKSRLKKRNINSILGVLREMISEKKLLSSLCLGSNVLEKAVENIESLMRINCECDDIRSVLLKEVEERNKLELRRQLVRKIVACDIDRANAEIQAREYRRPEHAKPLDIDDRDMANSHDVRMHYEILVLSWCFFDDGVARVHVLENIQKNLLAKKIPIHDEGLLSKMWLVLLIDVFVILTNELKEEEDLLFDRAYRLIEYAIRNGIHENLSVIHLKLLENALETTSNRRDEARGLYQDVYNARMNLPGAHEAEDASVMPKEPSSDEQLSDEEGEGVKGSYDVTVPEKSDKAVTVTPQSLKVKQAGLSRGAEAEVKIKICGYDPVDIKRHLETQCDELGHFIDELYSQRHSGLGPYLRKEKEVKGLIVIVEALKNQVLRPGTVSVEPSWGYNKQKFIDACYQSKYLEESDARGIIFYVAGLPDENVEQDPDYIRKLSLLRVCLSKIQQPVYKQLFMWSWFYKVMPLFNRFVLSQEQILMTADDRRTLLDLVKFGFCFNAHLLLEPDWLKQTLDKEDSEWFPAVDETTRSFILTKIHEYFDAIEKKKSSLVEAQKGQELTGQQGLPSDQEESDTVYFTQFWSPADAVEEVEKILWDRQYESTINERCLPPLSNYETESGGVKENSLDVIMNLLLIRYRVKEDSIIGDKLESIQIAIDKVDVRDRKLLSAFFLYRLIDFWEYFFNHEAPRATVWSYIELIAEMVRWTLVRGIHQSQYIEQWFLEKSLRLLDRFSQQGVENYKDIQAKIFEELWGQKLDKTTQLVSQLVNDEIEDSDAENRTKDEPLNVERALTVTGDEFNSYELHEHFLYVLLCWYRPISNENRLKIFESVLRNVFDQDIFDDDIKDLLLRLLLIRMTQYSDWITPQKIKDKDACTNQLLGIVKLSVEHDIQERLPVDWLEVLHVALVSISNAENRKDGGEGEIINVALAKGLSESVARSLHSKEAHFSALLPTPVEKISDDESSIESREDIEIDDIDSYVDNILMKRESYPPVLMSDLGHTRGKYLSFVGKHKELTHDNVTDILNYLLRVDYEISEAEDVENALRPVQSVIPCIVAGEDHQRCAKLFMHMMMVNLQRLYIYQCAGKSLDEYEVECLELFSGYLNWCFEQGFNQWFERDEVDHVLGVLNYFENRQIILISDSMKIIVDDYVIRRVMDTYYEGENIELESDQSLRHLTLKEIANNALPASLSPQEGAEAAICNEIVFADKTVPIVEIIEQLLWCEDAQCPIAVCRTTTCASRLFKRIENNALKTRMYRNMFLHAIESHRASETAFVVQNLPESTTSDFHLVVKDGLMYIQQLRLMYLRTPTVELQDQNSLKGTSIPEGMAMRRYFRAEAFNSALQAKANSPGGAIPLEECGIILGPEWRNQLSGLILSGEVNRVMNLENIAASKPVPFWRHIDTKDIKVDIKFVCDVCLHYQRQPVEQRDEELYENYKLLVNQFHNDNPEAFWLVNNDKNIQSKIAIFSLLTCESRQNLNEVEPDSLKQVVLDSMCIRYPREDVDIRQIKNQANNLLRRGVRATNWQSLVRIYVQFFYGKSNPITKPEIKLMERLENRLQKKSADLLSFDSFDNDYNLSCLEAIYWHKLWSRLTI
ncbi:hypothetical protein [Kistimonas asteriae]|uniref:hypothetical protein n=1 Tax=Kistimonas asteriae TaxID=517724 RepID=UPI001BA590AA|nr:hypothetical protein [Kistimonas asteriae]